MDRRSHFGIAFATFPATGDGRSFSSVGSRKRILIGLAVAVVVVAAGVAFLIRDDGPSNRATDFKSPPYTRGIEVGRTYNYSLLTHCGVEAANIDGTSWRATPPLGNGSAPEGWSNLATVGRLTIVNKNKAIFKARGREATFVRDNLPRRLCM